MNEATLCVHVPPVSREGFESLTVPIERASTIVFPTAEAFHNRHKNGPQSYSYGLYGTPTARTLEAQISALAGASGTVLAPSGQAAAAAVLLGLLRPGDHLLLPDTVYGPVRTLADGFLTTIGVSATYYDPLSGQEISRHFTQATRLVWVESPGSGTFEVQDVPAIVAAAHAHGALVACDNTWATPLLFRPLAVGADISVEAISKHMGGHSDLLLGSVSARDEAILGFIRNLVRSFGLGVSPDDCSLALRGLQTLSVRLRHQGAAGLSVARWMNGQPCVARVWHPALPSAPGHEIWRRDFSGAAGVFSVSLRPECSGRLDAALGGLKLFRIGASWGGTNSLVAPVDLSGQRTATRWDKEAPLLRFSIGLEDEADIMTDLAGFFAALSGTENT
ncbi:MAG TPA: cystathionine beta-lyase [Microvirga sp.]|nr:cystathionine beta-lyase [Microvirga sp.]